MELARARAVTSGPLYHWFGYYDMPCWDRSGRYLLSLGAPFEDRPPTADDKAYIGLTDMCSSAYRVVAETRAFNWQQGAMLHWLPSDPERCIIYNDRIGDRFVSVILDVFSGVRHVLGRATSDVGQGGRWALSLNFARLAQTRPGYGYAGLPDPFGDALHPADDGIYAIEMASGRERLIVSLEQVLQHVGAPTEMAAAKMWFNHTLLNPSETRFVFLTRWRPSGSAAWKTLMFSANLDGSQLKLVLDGGMVSHFDWRNDEELLVWTRIGEQGDRFYLVNEHSGAYQIVGAECLTSDGHCCYSHRGDCFVTDTYPRPPDYVRTLKLYVPAQEREIVVGRYPSSPPFVGEVRCDLHPRWSWDDRLICFDSVHEGHRQIYVIDAPPLA
jgi:hypothetical protein